MLPSLAIFLITYFFIATEKVDKMIAAVLGASAVIFLHQIGWEEAFAKIDLNVIFLLIGMMLSVNTLANTGVFEWISITVAQKARGSGIRILVLLLFVTAVLSAFLDNVTTVIIIAPITILITQFLELPTVPFLILEAIFSNIGGTGTLVGDPPNIIIGSQSHLDFNSFIINLGPAALAIVLIGLIICIVMLRKSYVVSDKAKQRLMQACPEEAILHPQNLKKSLAVLALIFLGFFTSHSIHVETGIIALAGGFLMLLVTKEDVHVALAKVEWSTILFFCGLFMLVGALEENGLFELLGHKVVGLTAGNLMLTCIVILWFSAIFSAFLDNIPMVISTIPIIKTIIPIFAVEQGLDPASSETLTLIAEPLYWSLALGACLGGNGTIIGASANVVVTQIAHRNNYALSFFDFFRLGFPIMILSVIAATGYIYLRYFM